MTRGKFESKRGGNGDLRGVEAFRGGMKKISSREMNSLIMDDVAGKLGLFRL